MIANLFRFDKYLENNKNGFFAVRNAYFLKNKKDRLPVFIDFYHIYDIALLDLLPAFPALQQAF